MLTQATRDQVTADLIDSATRRYSGYHGHCNEARSVGRCVSGDIAYIDQISEKFDREEVRWSIIDPCLASLLFALLDWRERTVFGGLPDMVQPMPREEEWDIDALVDVLLVLGMYETEYEFPALSNLTEEPHILPGWTYRGLCELMALHLCRPQRIEAAKEKG